MIEELKPCPEMVENARKLIAIVMSHVQCTEAGATWLHTTDAEDDVTAFLTAYDPDKRLREALERVAAIWLEHKSSDMTADEAVGKMVDVAHAALSHNGG